MPTRVLLAKIVPPSEIEKLNTAFETHCDRFITDGKHDSLGEIVARKMIEIRETGVWGSATIADTVVKQLKLE
jgi:hypothetical protein